MTVIPELQTERLLLRAWKEEDRPPFAALNSVPEVMTFLPKLLSPEESDARVQQIQQHFENHGFGLWAVEVLETSSFIGFTGLNIPAFATSFTPCVEIGWRLARNAWGHGYATEAARAVLRYAFDTLGFDNIVSYTVPENERSWHVMERLGMTHAQAEDFDHPLLPADHRLSRHLLYRIKRADFVN